MRIVIQRIVDARVIVEGEIVGEIGPGLCVFLGIAKGDSEKNTDYLVEKVKRLRIFEDEHGKMNRDVVQANGEILLVSEFTLYGDCATGNRPSFSRSAPSEEAKPLYDYFVRRLQESGLRVSTGRFQAKMRVAMTNDGPVTLIVEN